MPRTCGRIATYNAGCRCADCRAVVAAKSRRRRRARWSPSGNMAVCVCCGETFKLRGYYHHEAACVQRERGI